MRRFTKSLALILCAVVMFICFVPAFADDVITTYTASGVVYELNNTYYTASVHSCEEDVPDIVVIPSTISYNGHDYTVNRIEENVFAGRTTITSITINEGVAQIDGNAFANCSSLREVHLPKTLTVCALTAFNGCTNLKVYAYKGVNNLSIIGASSNIEFIYPEQEPIEAKSFFENLWEKIVNFFKRLADFFTAKYEPK